MEDFIPVFAIFAVFGTITAIVFGPTYLRSREKREMQATLRHAIDKGQELPAEVIEAMTRDVARNLPSRTRDIRRGIIWLAVGVGLAAFGLINDAGWGNDGWEGHFGNGMLGIAAIPVTIGLAFIVLSFFNKNKD
jgi:hypothetical protein